MSTTWDHAHTRRTAPKPGRRYDLVKAATAWGCVAFCGGFWATVFWALT